MPSATGAAVIFRILIPHRNITNIRRTAAASSRMTTNSARLGDRGYESLPWRGLLCAARFSIIHASR